MSSLNKRHKGTHQSSQRQGIWDRPWPPNTHTHFQTAPSETPASQTLGLWLIFSPDFGGRVMCLGLLLKAHRASVHLHYHAIWYCTEEVNDVIILTAAMSFRPAEQTCLPAADRAVLGDVSGCHSLQQHQKKSHYRTKTCTAVMVSNESNIYTVHETPKDVKEHHGNIMVHYYIWWSGNQKFNVVTSNFAHWSGFNSCTLHFFTMLIKNTTYFW